jgi:S1-C subfamily serine protease
LASACHGTVVSEAEAKAIKERRNQAIARVLTAQPRSDPEGMRLAKLGTAFYINEIGEMLTNHHVIVDCRVVTVHTRGGTPVNAQVLAIDAQHDLALLQSSAGARDYAVFRSEQAVGMSASVATVGYPDEGLPSLEPAVTPGALLKGDDGLGHILIHANVRSGNSGGPIFDSTGLVIGIVNAELDQARFYARTGKQASDTGAGIALSTISGFLRRTNARYHVANEGETLDPGRILKLATAFVARAECWE